eukprot:TRINITY_DN15734_c0_g1_i1.p1 TRINITY_DN15734_c0_g1~~TRINITY_DN15734_c0_g1_i1.p1  ORF type:complete len:190 (+),score=63.38 TRINITY_DN15734_c0_g1_i1:53-571(+)
MPYTFPGWHSLPPSFTVQPERAARVKQVQLWTKLLIDYCTSERVWQLTAQDAVFANSEIGRRLPADGVQLVFQSLVDARQAAWRAKGQQSQGIWVFWRSVQEWGAELHSWADSIGVLGTVSTVFELCEGSSSEGAAWEGMPREMLMHVLRDMESRGMAVVIADASGDGVKIV